MGLKSVLVALAIPALATARALPQFETNLHQIVGGEAAQEGEFPFIVSLQRGSSHFCGGSLLNADTVITAAHCAQGQTATNLRIRAGSLNKNSGGTLVNVSSLVINPNFSSSTLDSDVAILKLATPIPESSTIGYATLPPSGSDPAPETITTTAGWGALTQGGASPTLLQKVDVPVISRTDCRASYGEDDVTETMFCAGLNEGGKDSCQGDSGGPIVDASTKVLLGAVSWGIGCAQPNNPGVYTNFGALIPFIDANL